MKGDSIGGPIRWRMHISVPPERLFAVLDSDDGRASFWAESAVEVEGQIEFRFITGHTCTSTVLERRPPEVLSIDYIGGQRADEAGCSGDGRCVVGHGDLRI